MLHTTNTLIDIYNVEMTYTKGNFTINTEVSKVDRAESSLQRHHSNVHPLTRSTDGR